MYTIFTELWCIEPHTEVSLLVMITLVVPSFLQEVSSSEVRNMVHFGRATTQPRLANSKAPFIHSYRLDWQGCSSVAQISLDTPALLLMIYSCSSTSLACGIPSSEHIVQSTAHSESHGFSHNKFRMWFGRQCSSGIVSFTISIHHSNKRVSTASL